MIGSALLLLGCGRQVRTPADGGKVVLHRIDEGESLEEIAENYYGDPGRAGDLRDYNGLADEAPSAGTFIHVPLTREELRALEKREEARIPYNEGLQFAARGAYVDAVEKFKASLVADPDFLDARYNLGVTYQNMKAYDQALKQYNLLARWQKRKPKYAFATGYCYFHLNRYDRAVQWFDEVLALDREHTQAQFALAATYEKMGDVEQAKRAWRRYLQMDSGSEWAAEAKKRLESLGQ
ncbi:MAG: tetratricopeptide repeat protein [Candidatus Latescibacterota bacterium]